MPNASTSPCRAPARRYLEFFIVVLPFLVTWVPPHSTCHRSSPLPSGNFGLPRAPRPLGRRARSRGGIRWTGPLANGRRAASLLLPRNVLSSPSSSFQPFWALALASVLSSSCQRNVRAGQGRRFDLHQMAPRGASYPDEPLICVSIGSATKVTIAAVQSELTT